jgi:hypothetical protein
VAITGLASGETLLAIDFRPATGQLYGVSSASRLYVINQNTGVARAIGAGAFSPAVAGNLVGFDFNPTVDRIRLVTSTGQNLRLHPETGTVAATDGVLNGAAGATITGAAYTNNTAGATTTVLYDLDPATDQLYRQDPPNNGTLVAMGSLNLNISGDGGFDIDAKTGTALGLYAVNGNPTLFVVDLTNGAARPLAQYNASAGYSGLAIPTQPVAYAGVGSQLRIFNPTDSSPLITKLVGGLTIQNASIEDLDFRPSTGQLYAIARNRSSLGDPNPRLYTIDLGTGMATLVARLSVPLQGQTISMDFNPVDDQIRLLTERNGILRINPDNGDVTVDGPLVNPGEVDPFPIELAYDNNVAGASTATLYVLGARDAGIYRISSPATGGLTTIGRWVQPGSLGAYVGGFDIGGMSNIGYALLQPNTPINSTVVVPIQIVSINLSTGQVTVTREFARTFGGDGFTVGLGF